MGLNASVYLGPAIRVNHSSSYTSRFHAIMSCLDKDEKFTCIDDTGYYFYVVGNIADVNLIDTNINIETSGSEDWENNPSIQDQIDYFQRASIPVYEQLMGVIPSGDMKLGYYLIVSFS